MSHEDPYTRPIDLAGQPPRIGHRVLDLITAGTAIFISVVSLVVAIRAEQTQHTLLAASSWPFIEISIDLTPTAASLDVENEGIGPAKIYTFELIYDGKPYEDWHALLHDCCGLITDPAAKPAASQGAVDIGQVSNNVLRPGEHALILKVAPVDATHEMFARFVKSIPAISFRGCYCSVLQECWTSDLIDITPNPVATCPPVAHPFTAGFTPVQTFGR